MINDKVLIKIDGLNLNRVIENLVRHNVLVDNLISYKKSIKFSIFEKDIKMLKKVCRQEHKICKIIYRNKFKNFLLKLPYQIGSFLAILITFIYMFSFSLFVFDVKVSESSNNNYDLTKVYNILNEYNIKPGILKNKFKPKEIEKIVVANVDDISSCSVKYDGGKLKICVNPSKIKYENNKNDIISKYDAVILRAEAYQGDLNVKVGDLVKKGDILIKNNDGAKGKIDGKVYYTGTIIYNKMQQKTIKTGRIIKNMKIKIFNKYLINLNKKNIFSTFLTEKCSFYIFDNYFLPLLCDEIVYHETKIIEEEIPFEVVSNKIKQEAYFDAIKDIKDKKQITNISYSIVNDGNYTRVDCFVEVEMSLI